MSVASLPLEQRQKHLVLRFLGVAQVHLEAGAQTRPLFSSTVALLWDTLGGFMEFQLQKRLR